MKLRLKKSALSYAALTVLALSGCGGANEPDDTLVDGVEMEDAERLRWRSLDSVAPTERTPFYDGWWDAFSAQESRDTYANERHLDNDGDCLEPA